MLSRSVLLSIPCLLALAACSGGSATDPGPVVPSCATGVPQSEALCLASCNLGCTTAGCSINQIAQNQPLIFTFNQDVDPATVNSSTVSLRTAAGEEPVGTFLVSGSVVTFLPEVLSVGATSFFGFRAGETYLLSLPAGASQPSVLRSVSGDELAAPYQCALTVSRGVLDLDEAPPQADMISPAGNGPFAPNAQIVLEFSEFITHAPFLTSTAANQPIVVRVQRQRPAAGGGTECDPAFVPQELLGTWDLRDDLVRQLTTATFVPAQTAPSGVCIHVEVTARVEDLAGTPSPGQRFQFTTRPTPQPAVTLHESFQNSLGMEFDSSSGAWGGGVAMAGDIGWDGAHGVFAPELGVEVEPNVWEWNTDNQLIPRTHNFAGVRSHTLSGNDEVVTDGVFRFSKFVLTKGVRVRFVGSNPARIFVRGLMKVDGILDLAGGSLMAPDGNDPVGQAGAVGGSSGGAAGSAAGGDGADMGDGQGNQPRFNGRNGQDAQVPAGHAYATRARNSAGRGSGQFPATGLDSDVDMTQVLGQFSGQVAAGGGGAGFAVAGSEGEVLVTPTGAPAEAGPPADAGTQFDLLPIPAGVDAWDHMLIGGAGGGGAGSHPFLSVSQPGSTQIRWRSGGGGAGGGGALGLRIGRDFELGLDGVIDASGGSTGDAPSFSANNFGVPGGAGAGGSVLLQVASSVLQTGKISIAGGLGGSSFGIPTNWNMQSKGGDASHGFLRLETTQTPALTLLKETEPMALGPQGQVITPSITVAPLTAEDSLVGAVSIWTPTLQVFPPIFERYEMDLIPSPGAPVVTYSDDPAVGMLAGQGQPVRFYAQGAGVDALGQVDPDSIKPWRRYVGDHAAGQASVHTDGAVMIRFLLLFDRALSTTAVVDHVRIVFRPL